MIFDNIRNMKCYEGISENLDKAFDYILNNDLKNIDIGKYDIIRDNVFAIVQDYMTKDDGDLEIHKKYIDVQYIIEGEEKIGFAKLTDLGKEKTSYNPEKDIAFYEGKQNFVILNKGDFLVLFPQDAHAPSLKVEDSGYVKKVVIKVRV